MIRKERCIGSMKPHDFLLSCPAQRLYQYVFPPTVYIHFPTSSSRQLVKTLKNLLPDRLKRRLIVFFSFLLSEVNKFYYVL